MTLKTRLARAERAASTRRRQDLSHIFEGVVLPAGEDRFEVFMDHFARAYALVGEDVDRQEFAEAMQPLVAQLTVEELRELAEQAREAPL